MLTGLKAEELTLERVDAEIAEVEAMYKAHQKQVAAQKARALNPLLNLRKVLANEQNEKAG